MLCFKINRQLSTDLRKSDDLSLSFTLEKPVYFSKYRYTITEREVEFYLIANKGTQGYLIPEMKSADYFIIIKNFYDDEELELYLDRLNAIPEVVVAAELDPAKLKSKENLIF